MKPVTWDSVKDTAVAISMLTADLQNTTDPKKQKALQEQLKELRIKQLWNLDQVGYWDQHIKSPEPQ